jgi:hypothetical protein
MKAYGGVDKLILVFLTPVLDGVYSATGPSRFNLEEICSYA